MNSTADSTFTRDVHPARSERVERTLDARHIDYAFEPNLALGVIKDVEGNQVRLDEHRAPRQMVGRYAEQMKRGAVFPALVVNEHNELVDGNTRCAAAIKIGVTVYPAYICSGLTSLEARSLSVELNQSHGLRMTDNEVRAFVSGCVGEMVDLDATAYARMTGAKVSTIRRWIAVEGFRRRLARMSVLDPGAARLSESVQAAIDKARLDAVCRAVTELAVAARLSAGQVNSLVGRANAASTEQRALDIVAGERAMFGIVEQRASLGTKRRGSATALHIGGLLRYKVDDLLDVAPVRQAEALQNLRMVRDLLDAAVMAAQVRWSLTEQGETPLAEVA